MGTLYENIKELCDSKGVKPAEFCRAVELPRNFVTELKAGRKTGINASTAKKIADYFGVDTDIVLTGKKEKPTENGELSETKKRLLQLVDGMDESDIEKLIKLMEEAKKII